MHGRPANQLGPEKTAYCTAAVADIAPVGSRAQDVAELHNECGKRPRADAAQWIIARRNAAGGVVAHRDERGAERLELSGADAAQRVVLSAAAD